MKLGQPQTLGNFSYFGTSNTENLAMVRGMYVQDLNGDGSQEVIVAGFESQGTTPNAYTTTGIRVFGWSSGKLVDVTTQVLPNGMDRVEGVGDVVFGDFNGDGRVDVFLSAYTDSENSANSYVLYNQGGQFTRTNLGADYWKHGADSADINGDGYADIFATGYTSPKIYLGGPQGLTEVTVPQWGEASGVALGDFLGNGKIQAILVDNWTLWQPGATGLYTIESDYQLRPHSLLPTPLLETEPYRNLGIESHDVSATPLDFNNDGKLDLLVMSRASDQDGPDRWPNLSRLQFLENQGNGKFLDVTDQRLVGWNEKTHIGYDPIIGDFDKDGDNDIFLSYESNVASTRILINDNGRFTDTGIDKFGSVMEVWKSIGGIARDDRGNYHFLVDTLKFTDSGSRFSMTSYSLSFGEETTEDVVITVDATGPRISDEINSDTVFIGGPGNDTIRGSASADTISGGPGNDVLYGGKGKDKFVFDNLGGMDTIQDFGKKDRIVLDKKVFVSLDNKPNDNLVYDRLQQDHNDFLLYEDGILYYDVDGGGAMEPVPVVELIGQPTVTAKSFEILP